MCPRLITNPGFSEVLAEDVGWQPFRQPVTSSVESRRKGWVCPRLITSPGFAEVLAEDENVRSRFVTGSDAMQKIRRAELVGCAVLLASVFPGAGEAYGGVFSAYIDPGTGSLIIQIVLAVLVGAGFAIKIFWMKIKTFLSKVFARKRDDSDK